jgi:hypothetical protein
MKKTLYVFAWSCFALLALPAAAQVPSYVPTDGLVGWWPFNGNANDESGNGNDGVVNGATLSVDRLGNAENAYSFNGTTNYIQVPNSSSLSNMGSITISVWTKINSWFVVPGNNSNFFPMINKSDNSENGKYTLYLTQNNGNSFQFGSQFHYNFQFPFELNNWYHVACTFSDNQYNVFINGLLVNGDNYSYAGGFNNDLPLIFGRDASGYTEFSNGLLDDIAIYNRALSQEEITALYTGEPVSPPAACTPLPANLQEGLVGYWPFCGNANDESGNGNDGTVNGATLTEDRFGNAGAAYEFDGVDDYIQTNFPGIAGNNSRSVSFWAKTSGINVQVSDNMNVLCYGSPGNGATFEVAINHSCEGLTLDINAGVNTFSTTTSDNSWKHYTLVYDNSLGNDFNAVKYYSNGQLLSVNCQQGELTPINSSTNNPTTLGAYWNHLIRFFNGSLDDIAIYNRALTQEEITALYTGEPVSPPAACTPLPANLQEGLVGYWPFCGNANDESGNGHDGTVNGATLTEDRFGNANAAYDFNGGPNFSADRIICNNPLTNDSDFSFSFWLRNESTSPDWTVPLMIQGANSSYEFYFTQDSIAFDNFDLQQATINTQLTFSNSVNTENFNNYCFSYDGSELTLYLNGNYSSSYSTSNLITPFDGQLFIGKHCCFLDDMPTGFNGALDDIAIYNRALTPAEVQELYTLDACTFTVYDTLTTYETIYDTLYTYETVYDTLTTYETVLDTLTTYETVYDTLTTYETVFDTLVTYETLFDTLTTYETLYDTITTVEMLYDTVTTYETLYDTLTTYETIVDTLYEYETITAYDTVTTFVTVTDTLLIDITFTGIEGQPSWLNTVTVFPNPASDHITIDYGNFALMAGYNMVITDAAGATVYTNAVNSQQAYIDINAWGAAGVYYLTIYDAGGAPVAVRHIVLE